MSYTLDEYDNLFRPDSDLYPAAEELRNIMEFVQERCEKDKRLVLRFQKSKRDIHKLVFILFRAKCDDFRLYTNFYMLYGGLTNSFEEKDQFILHLHLLQTLAPGKREGKDPEQANKLLEEAAALVKRKRWAPALEKLNTAVILCPGSKLDVDIPLPQPAICKPREDMPPILHDKGVITKVLWMRSKVLKKMDKYELALHDLDYIRIENGIDATIRHKYYKRLGEILKALKESEKANQAFLLHKYYSHYSIDIIQNMQRQIFAPKQDPDSIEKTNPDYTMFLAPSVTYTETKREGAHSIAQEDITSGEVILKESAYASILLPEYYSTHCLNCYKRVEAPYSCPRCIKVRFCSEACRNIGINYHKYECEFMAIWEGTGLSLDILLALRMMTLHGFKKCKQIHEKYIKPQIFRDCCCPTVDDNEQYYFKNWPEVAIDYAFKNIFNDNDSSIRKILLNAGTYLDDSVSEHNENKGKTKCKTKIIKRRHSGYKYMASWVDPEYRIRAANSYDDFDDDLFNHIMEVARKLRKPDPTPPQSTNNSVLSKSKSLETIYKPVTTTLLTAKSEPMLSTSLFDTGAEAIASTSKKFKSTFNQLVSSSKPLTAKSEPVLSTSKLFDTGAEAIASTSKNFKSTFNQLVSSSKPLTAKSEPVLSTSKLFDTGAEAIASTSKKFKSTFNQLVSSSKPLTAKSEPVLSTSKLFDTGAEAIASTSKKFKSTFNLLVSSSKPLTAKSEPVVSASKPLSTRRKSVSSISLKSLEPISGPLPSTTKLNDITSKVSLTTIHVASASESKATKHIPLTCNSHEEIHLPSTSKSYGDYYMPSTSKSYQENYLSSKSTSYDDVSSTSSYFENDFHSTSESEAESFTPIASEKTVEKEVSTSKPVCLTSANGVVDMGECETELEHENALSKKEVSTNKPVRPTSANGVVDKDECKTELEHENVLSKKEVSTSKPVCPTSANGVVDKDECKTELEHENVLSKKEVSTSKPVRPTSANGVVDKDECKTELEHENVLSKKEVSTSKPVCPTSANGVVDKDECKTELEHENVLSKKEVSTSKPVCPTSANGVVDKDECKTELEHENVLSKKEVSTSKPVCPTSANGVVDKDECKTELEHENVLTKKEEVIYEVMEYRVIVRRTKECDVQEWTDLYENSLRGMLHDKRIYNLSTNVYHVNFKEYIKLVVMSAFVYDYIRRLNFAPCGYDTKNAGFSRVDLDMMELFIRNLLLVQHNGRPMYNYKSNPDTLKLEKEIYAYGIYANSSMNMHDCNPNVMRTFDGKVVSLRALRYIKSGTKITDCFGPDFANMAPNLRRRYLKKRYFFNCLCLSCEEDWPPNANEHRTTPITKCQYFNCGMGFKGPPPYSATCPKCKNPVPESDIERNYYKSKEIEKLLRKGIALAKKGKYKEAISQLTFQITAYTEISRGPVEILDEAEAALKYCYFKTTPKSKL